ncbi:ABC transporter ATP-binding protein [Clostridium botulinum]|uniref:ABC transporter ATP-binding protein n=1 Tax=Clostridium botulinum TaxID=1491 RepID=UPI00016BA222|nr:ABC transporter ATP-binding protein [Clostridium botulinum]EDT86382.1 ABC transporter, ATP-binding/permease protein [Clostridium botulinum Bf]NEZ87558.1 ABC transporter ATP-binding protein [Clostridium botulinum]NFE31766.1 ABC transporter ATP-binding protein [Clostridium botulinum]WCJ74861.1 ABC transporter ATP-binding protein/permease [Clostridium botulinum]WCJ78700.1 ABC transporter ATP-binding protein/permease [Clostridium botulinum]
MKNTKVESPISRLREFAKPHRASFIGSVLLAIIGVASGMIPYFAVANMVVKLIGGEKNISYYGFWCVLAAAGFILKTIFMNLSTTVSHTATYATLEEIRLRLVSKLSRVPMGYIIETPSGKLKSIIVDQVESIESTLAHLIPEMTSNLLVPIAIVVYMFILDWRMALVSFITLPIGFLCYKGMAKDYEKRFSGFVGASKKMNTTVIEYVNGIEVIKAFNQSANSYEKYTDAVTGNANYAVNWMKDCQIFMSMCFTVWPAVLVSVLPFGCYFCMKGSLTIPVFITIVILSLGIVEPILSAISFTDRIGQIGTVVGDVSKVLDAPELERPTKEKKLKDLTIELKDVKFSYDKESQILNGVNLKINPGTVTGFVGPSGSGKSTITKLIAGFWDVTEGSISIGNINIKEIPQKQLMEQIAYVSQDNYLFDDTIRENIRMGKTTATNEEIEAAAKASGCHEFIMKLEKGYNTVVGGAGGHISGGERQRIAIARAMLKDAPIVILDEATAYTDPENEAIIQESVGKLVANKTLIVIAHRLSTVIDSDKLVVVKNGKIVAEGTHKQLLADCKLYRSMWEAHVDAKDEA